MLGKLLRHEWKAVWKVPTLLIGALMVASVMAGIPFLFPIWESDWIGLPLSAVMLMLLFFAAMIATSFGIVIYLTVRYYKSMYTDEGYLTHTLPVKGRDLLLSKTIVMSVWNLISGIAVFVAMMIFYVIMLFGLTTRTSFFTAEFMDALGELRTFEFSLLRRNVGIPCKPWVYDADRCGRRFPADHGRNQLRADGAKAQNIGSNRRLFWILLRHADHRYGNHVSDDAQSGVCRKPYGCFGNVCLCTLYADVLCYFGSLCDFSCGIVFP